MQKTNIDDCFIHDKDRLTHQEAIEILKTNISPITGLLNLPLMAACNHVTSQAINAPRPIPAHRNAAVDGYAFSDEHYDRQQGSWHQITHRIKAGDPLTSLENPKAAARIFTGAVMPDNLTSVVMQEDIRLQERGGQTEVFIPAGLKPGANCRQAGEDTKQGAPLVGEGVRLMPQHIAALAAGGIDQVNVFRPLKIACFSTGDEIIRNADQFRLGRVFDSNGPMLTSLCQMMKTNVTDLGILKDQRQTVMNALTEAAVTHDVIITSGGASKGEEDHIIASLDELGTRHMWQLAIKPGRPMTFGQIGESIFIGLPGNPVAAFICFLLYASPLLTRLGGALWPEPPRFRVPAAFSIKKKKPNRREFLRGTLIRQNGVTQATKFEKDGSGLIQSLIMSDGLIELDEACESLEEGELVDFLPFSYWGL